MFRRATPVLRSADYARSRKFYTEQLGFNVVEEGGDPARFGILERDRAVIFIDSWHDGPGAKQKGWNAYFHLENLKAFHSELTAAGAPIVRDPEKTNYGMLEMEVMDPDGNVICFGQELSG
ncbi:MAG: VOC family protein [Candidatus Eisenbacteria bacterium]|uniref:Bleomycin resistance protein n=1 Tax=Eiseniibacteriota bacterium TaxID=2212470 RepID=A0A7Y2EDL0_UNCEI|nr:VOC family protein [Candidatus Eisenbacteria bacterium]